MNHNKISDNRTTHWNLFSLAEILINTHKLNSNSTEQTLCSCLIILGQQPIDNQRCAAKYTIYTYNSEMALLGNDIVEWCFVLFYKRNQLVRVTMVSNKAMSTANTNASMINKLANCKPPVLAKQRMKRFNIHVNLKTWNCGAVRETMAKVGCSIEWNGAMHFSNYFYYFEILYTRASNEDMSSSFLQRRHCPSLHVPRSLGAACF